MKMFHAALNALLKTAPKKDVRYYLNGVAFTDSLIVATDGHVATAIGVNGKRASDFMRHDAVILADHDIKSVQHWLKGLATGRVKADQIDVTWRIAEGVVTFTANNSYDLALGSTVDGVFPDIARVFRCNNLTPKTTDIAFLAPTMEKIIYTAKQLSDKKLFNLNLAGASVGAIVEYSPLGDYTVQSVLMPARF